MQDLGYALRQLRKTPGFTLASVVTPARGVGANTAVFSALNALLLKMLPVLPGAGLPSCGELALMRRMFGDNQQSDVGARHQEHQANPDHHDLDWLAVPIEGSLCRPSNPSRATILERINDGDFEMGEITLIAGGHGESMNASRGGDHGIFAYRIGSVMH